MRTGGGSSSLVGVAAGSSGDETGVAGATPEGISVTTIGLGLGFNEDLMARLAQRSDGNTYFVEESSDLPRIFAAMLAMGHLQHAQNARRPDRQPAHHRVVLQRLRVVQ